jgi:hypothetical protein
MLLLLPFTFISLQLLHVSVTQKLLALPLAPFQHLLTGGRQSDKDQPACHTLKWHAAA